jgi:HK97 family phage major capsid protein
MKLEEFNAKVAELKAEGTKLAQEGKLDAAEAKKKEIEALEASFQAEKEAVAEENAITKDSTIQANFQSEQTLGEENKVMEKMYDASSVEYKNAFLKHISGRDDQMTKLENEAFVHTTQNTPNVLPTTMLNKIWDLVSKNHVIVGDVTTYRTSTILEVVKHTAIVQGAAAVKAEGVANDDEQNTFVKVTLSGKDFVKSVEISYAEAKMSIEALEGYLVQEISTSIGEAIADDMVSQIESDLNNDNKVNAAVSGTLSFADVTGAFAKLKRNSKTVVYCSQATLYNYIVGMTNSAGQLIYQANANEGANGVLLGAKVKIEDSVADGKILMGDPQRVVNNIVQDILVETDKDIKKHKFIYSGYERSECALVDDRAFVEITVNF